MGHTCSRFQKGVPSFFAFLRTTVMGFSSRTASRIAAIWQMGASKGEARG